jgi:hypothetical protein
MAAVDQAGIDQRVRAATAATDQHQADHQLEQQPFALLRPFGRVFLAHRSPRNFRDGRQAKTPACNRTRGTGRRPAGRLPP